jgi:solute carrier family 25 protein 42
MPAQSSVSSLSATTESVVNDANSSSGTTSKLFDDIVKLPKEIRNIIAGGCAGMIAKSVVAPFDRIKILYQVSSAKFQIWKVPEIAIRIIQQEGLSALWKGNTATLIRVFPYSGIQFMVFDRCKTFLLREQEMNYMKEKAINPDTPKPKWGLSPMESLVAGMCAGAVSVVATYPLDLTRAQLAVMRTKKGERNIGFGQALFNNFRDRGVTGLFRGITPTMVGILPYAGLAFSFNEQAKRKVGV